MRVLVADDDLVSRLAMEDLLRQRGPLELVMAEDGARAWAALNEPGWDLVCLDVRMPPPDGLELAARLRASPALRRVPAMLITSTADRTVLAAERTYAAWMRTGLVSLASGLGARHLLEDVAPAWMIVGAETILLIFSAFCFLAGVWREITGAAPPPEPDIPRLPTAVLIVVSVFLALVAITALFGLLAGNVWRSG